MSQKTEMFVSLYTRIRFTKFDSNRGGLVTMVRTTCGHKTINNLIKASSHSLSWIDRSDDRDMFQNIVVSCRV